MLKGSNLLFEIYCAAFQGFCLQYFMGNFLEYRGRKKPLYVAVLYAVFILCANRLLTGGYEDMRAVCSRLVSFAVLLLFVFAFYRAARPITGYLAVTFMMVMQTGFFAAHSVSRAGGVLYDVWIWCIERGYIRNKTGITAIFDVTAIGQQMILCAVFSVLCFRSLRSIADGFREKDHLISRTELYFLLAPSAAGLLVCMLLRLIVVRAENGMPQVLYGSHPVLLLVIPAILGLNLLSVIYSVKLFQDMVSLNREKNSKAVLEKQVADMQGQIAELEHIYSGIRGMKHDMGNTIAVITQLAEEGGKTAELQQYLSELNRTFDRLELPYKTGNAVVDTLLNVKYHEMMRTMPDVKLYADKLLFTDNIVIGSYDIGVIVGNALDNAAEACGKMKGGGKEPFIRLSSFAKGKMFFIKVENSFDGKVVRKKGMEFPATDKPDKKTHGIGLANIKSTAEKYHGGVDWQAQDGVFTLTVMLKNERSTENEYR